MPASGVPRSPIGRRVGIGARQNGREDDGSSSGSIVVAGPVVDTLAIDFSKPGVTIGITKHPSGRMPRRACVGGT